MGHTEEKTDVKRLQKLLHLSIYLYMAEAKCLLDYSARAFHKLDLLHYWLKSKNVRWIQFIIILFIYLLLFSMNFGYIIKVTSCA